MEDVEVRRVGDLLCARLDDVFVAATNGVFWSKARKSRKL